MIAALKDGFIQRIEIILFPNKIRARQDVAGFGFSVFL